MRKYFLSLAFVCMAYTSLNAQASNHNQQAKIHQTLNRFFDGFSALDTSIIRQSITKDFVLLEDGVVWNMDSIQANFVLVKNQIKDAIMKRVNHFDIIQTEITGNSAYVAYNNTANISLNDMPVAKLNWLESAFLVKEGNDWKIVLLHSTTLKPGKQ
ncbi:MAG TPA: nuclear transport factor 2 family protein [Ginsengibacter sp.]|nr:nuclear transport factor 2 family protein [Ginsengibacter sp.]